MAYNLTIAVPAHDDFVSGHTTFSEAQTALISVERTGGEYGVYDDVNNYMWRTTTGWLDQYGNPVEV
jgi:hypothetical protein